MKKMQVQVLLVSALLGNVVLMQGVTRVTGAAQAARQVNRPVSSSLRMRSNNWRGDADMYPTPSSMTQREQEVMDNLKVGVFVNPYYKAPELQEEQEELQEEEEQEETPLLTLKELRELGVDEQEDYIHRLRKEMRKIDRSRPQSKDERVISGGKVITVPMKVQYMDTPEQEKKKILINEFERAKRLEKIDQERRNEEIGGLRLRRMSQEELMSQVELKSEEESWLRKLIRSIFGSKSSE